MYIRANSLNMCGSGKCASGKFASGTYAKNCVQKIVRNFFCPQVGTNRQPKSNPTIHCIFS